jgi:spermidine synthase
LFSVEFYGRVREHLSPDGAFVQWLQLYETDMELVASIMKALSPRFSDYVVYNVDEANCLSWLERRVAFSLPAPK